MATRLNSLSNARAARQTTRDYPAWRDPRRSPTPNHDPCDLSTSGRARARTFRRTRAARARGGEPRELHHGVRAHGLARQEVRERLRDLVADSALAGRPQEPTQPHNLLGPGDARLLHAPRAGNGIERNPIPSAMAAVNPATRPPVRNNAPPARPRRYANRPRPRRNLCRTGRGPSRIVIRRLATPKSTTLPSAAVE